MNRSKLARTTGNTAAQGKALTDLVQTLAWCRPRESLELAPRAIEINDALRNRVELVKLHAAAAVAKAPDGDLDAVEREIDAGLTLTRQCGYPGGRVWCWAARAYGRLQHGDVPGYRAAVDEVTMITESLGGNRFWGEIVRWWSGVPIDHDQRADWIGGAESAMRRWRETRPWRAG